MLRQLRYDFSILFKRTPFLMTCSVLVLYIFMLTFSSLYEKDIIPLQYYGSGYMANLIMNQSGPFRYTSLLLIFPLIIAIPIGRMMIIERKSLTNILTRRNKKVYIISKLITSFMAGFLMMFITLIVAILFGLIIFGEEQSYYTQLLSIFYGYSIQGIKSSIRYYNLYFQNPMLYLLLYALLVSFVMGIVSQLTMIIALFTQFKVIIYGGIFVLSMLTIFVHPMMVPFYVMLSPYANVSTNLINAQFFYPIIFVSLLMILSVIYVRKDIIIK